MVAARLSLSSLQGISKGRWAAIILGTGGEGSVTPRPRPVHWVYVLQVQGM